MSHLGTLPISLDAGMRRSHLESVMSLICNYKSDVACPRHTCIHNEANLTCGENIGGTEGATTTPEADDGDDDGGDGDSDPDRRPLAKHAAKKTRARKACNGLPSDGYVRLPQIIGDPLAEPPIPAVIPVSKSSWWAGCKSGRYPAPVKLGPRTTAWRVSDIRALIEQSA